MGLVSIDRGMLKNNFMASENAKAVLRDVEATVRSGKIVNFQKIQIKNGYSKTSAKAMKAKKTATYQEGEKKIVEQLEKERQKILIEMKKKRGKAGYSDLVRGLEVTTKNIQLLSGGDTERQAIKITGFNYVKPDNSDNSSDD